MYFAEFQALAQSILEACIFLYCQNFVKCPNFGRKKGIKKAHTLIVFVGSGLGL